MNSSRHTLFFSDRYTSQRGSAMVFLFLVGLGILWWALATGRIHFDLSAPAQPWPDVPTPDFSYYENSSSDDYSFDTTSSLTYNEVLPYADPIAYDIPVAYDTPISYPEPIALSSMIEYPDPIPYDGY